MASAIIGRRPCLLACGFDAAHVKQSDKCTFMYCPGCGTNGPHARTPEQVALMTKGMRPVEAPPTPTQGKPTPTPAPTPAPTPTPTPAKADAEPAATPAPTPSPAPKRRGLFT